jgi:hypothetical protein
MGADVLIVAKQTFVGESFEVHGSVASVVLKRRAFQIVLDEPGVGSILVGEDHGFA